MNTRRDPWLSVNHSYKKAYPSTQRWLVSSVNHLWATAVLSSVLNLLWNAKTNVFGYIKKKSFSPVITAVNINASVFFCFFCLFVCFFFFSGIPGLDETSRQLEKHKWFPLHPFSKGIEKFVFSFLYFMGSTDSTNCCNRNIIP